MINDVSTSFGALAGLCLEKIYNAIIDDAVKSIKPNNNHYFKQEKKGIEKMTVSKKTKTVLSKHNGVLGITKYNDGVRYGNYYAVMPEIVDVRIYSDDKGYPCATHLYFADGTSTSAARREDDIYSIEHGISICITKKLLDMITDGAGNQTYNKLVRNAYKVLEHNEKAAEEAFEEAKALERKREKLVEKKRRRDERKNAEAREELIEIQKEAILRALREHTISVDDLK